MSSPSSPRLCDLLHKADKDTMKALLDPAQWLCTCHCEALAWPARKRKQANKHRNNACRAGCSQERQSYSVWLVIRFPFLFFFLTMNTFFLMIIDLWSIMLWNFGVHFTLLYRCTDNHFQPQSSHLGPLSRQRGRVSESEEGAHPSPAARGFDPQHCLPSWARPGLMAGAWTFSDEASPPQKWNK